MKFYLWFFGGILLILGVLIGGYWLSEKAPEVSKKIEEGMQAQPLDRSKPGASQQAPVQDQIKNNVRQQVAGGVPQDEVTLLKNAAIEAGVTVRQHGFSGGVHTVGLEWRGSRADRGGLFLDAIMGKGRLRDFDEVSSNVGYNDRGERVWTATYRIHLK